MHLQLSLMHLQLSSSTALSYSYVSIGGQIVIGWKEAGTSEFNPIYSQLARQPNLIIEFGWRAEWLAGVLLPSIHPPDPRSNAVGSWVGSCVESWVGWLIGRTDG